MRTADFDYVLPPELIAQEPAARRDKSRLLHVQRATQTLAHRQFRDLPEQLRAGDVLVLNNSRVIPARLRGLNPRTGGRFELLLLEENAVNDWWAMLRPGKRAQPGAEIELLDRRQAPCGISVIVTDMNADGHRRLQFHGPENILHHLDELGEPPLPPYIRRAENADFTRDGERYQTVYAQPPGSVAAPTAGLHFTLELLAELRARGIRTTFVTLHVGPGTFAPVKAETLDQHVMHEERYELGEAAAQLINDTKSGGGRIIAVGTTSLRVLESVAQNHAGAILPETGRTRLFVYPPREFQTVDALLTNFHLPKSTLLMLASAFAAPGETRGRELMLRAYAEAVRERYRFFSYGDAMLIV
jgi:S-adenosylmethionine:tRNA ribosyltransferase-isomerase